jgi:tetratricopeptide (TPR) repeat protein
MRSTAILFAIVLACALACEANAQQANQPPKKVALVIGNAAYPDLLAGGNPVRDAELIAGRLKELGFSLVAGRALADLDKATTARMLGTLGLMAQNADVAVVYFSGHGIGVDGKNYLLPIDYGNLAPAYLIANTVGVDQVLDVLKNSRARVKILLLDACRSPAKGGSSLVPIAVGAAVGTIIGFATYQGGEAWPGPKNGTSPYATALANYMRVKGLQVPYMLNEVGNAVMKETKYAQQPWVTVSTLVEPVYLNPPDMGAPALIAKTSGESIKYVQQGYKQLEMKDYSGARMTLTRGIELEPQSASAYSYRGYSWYLEGKNKAPQDAILAFKEALKDFDKSVDLDPNYSPARRHRGNVHLALYTTGKTIGIQTNSDLDHAIDDLKISTKLDPMSKTNANALGDAYLKKGMYELAIESYKKAIQIDKLYSSPYSGSCTAYLKLGNLEAAKKYAKLAAERDSGFSSKPCLKNDI